MSPPPHSRRVLIKIAAGDSDVINVRFGTPYGLKSDIPEVGEVPISDIIQSSRRKRTK